MERYGIAILRIITGIIFAAHGAQKLFVFGIDGVAGGMAQMGIPAPFLSAVLATSAELLGGIALIAGFYTRLSSVPLGATMLVAFFAVHLPQGFFMPNGFEFVLVLLGAVIALGLNGPGAFAVDNVRAVRSHPVLGEAESQKARVA